MRALVLAACALVLPASALRAAPTLPIASGPRGELYVGGSMVGGLARVTSGRVRPLLPSRTAAAAAGARRLEAVCLAADGRGWIYVYDGAFRVLRVSPWGQATVVAGTGQPGFSGDGGPARAARIGRVSALAADRRGNLYLADAAAQRVRRVGPTGVITTVAGRGPAPFPPRYLPIQEGAPALSVRLTEIAAMAADRDGSLYLAEPCRDAVRKITPQGRIYTLLGTLRPNDGPGGRPAVKGAGLRRPGGLTLDRFGNLYVSDTGHGRVLKIAPSRAVYVILKPAPKTASGGAAPARPTRPVGLAMARWGHLYVADPSGGRVYRLDGAHRPTVAAHFVPPPAATAVALARPSPAASAGPSAAPSAAPAPRGPVQPRIAAPPPTRPAPATRAPTAASTAPVARTPVATRPAPVTRTPVAGRPAPTTHAPAATRPAPVTRAPATTRPTPVTRAPAMARPAPVTPKTASPKPPGTAPAATRPAPVTPKAARPGPPGTAPAAGSAPGTAASTARASRAASKPAPPRASEPERLTVRDPFKQPAPPVRREDLRPAVLQAADAGNVVRLRSLLAVDPSLLEARDSLGRTPLVRAVAKGREGAVRFLLARRANVHARPLYGVTALSVAAAAGNGRLVQMLIAGGASVDVRDDRGRRPLHHAVASGGLEMIRLLVSYGADVNARDREGATALHLAARMGRYAEAQLLLALRANPSAKDAAGRTPLAAASAGGRKPSPELAALLRRYGG